MRAFSTHGDPKKKDKIDLDAMLRNLSERGHKVDD